VRYYTIVRFIDVGGIDDHHCLNNPFTEERRFYFILFFLDDGDGGIDDYLCLNFLFII
jgi:hypothetical protein